MQLFFTGPGQTSRPSTITERPTATWAEQPSRGRSHQSYGGQSFHEIFLSSLPSLHCIEYPIYPWESIHFSFVALPTRWSFDEAEASFLGWCWFLCIQETLAKANTFPLLWCWSFSHGCLQVYWSQAGLLCFQWFATYSTNGVVTWWSVHDKDCWTISLAFMSQDQSSFFGLAYKCDSWKFLETAYARRLSYNGVTRFKLAKLGWHRCFDFAECSLWMWRISLHRSHRHDIQLAVENAERCHSCSWTFLTEWSDCIGSLCFNSQASQPTLPGLKSGGLASMLWFCRVLSLDVKNIFASFASSWHPTGRGKCWAVSC